MQCESEASWDSLEAGCLISGVIFFIYFSESNPFICDLTCNDEIKLC